MLAHRPWAAKGKVNMVWASACLLAAAGLLFGASGGAGAMEPDGVRAPELVPNKGWLNTDRPLRLSDELRGHVVLLDFWTYCCINCMHVLPDLKYLEEKYKDEAFIVVGVHSAKFANEGERQSIRNAVFRYGVKHPVVIDVPNQREDSLWQQYAVRGWPTFVLIGADGKVVGQVSGEGQRGLLDRSIAAALAAGQAKGTLAKAPFRPVLDAQVAPATGLSFPGKVVGVVPVAGAEGRGKLDPKTGALFIADSGHNRVVMTTWPDAGGRAEVRAVFGGSGVVGEGELKDAEEPGLARFFDPQGMAVDVEAMVLYVADTKNHAVRRVDLATGGTTTLVGTGRQVYDRVGGKAGKAQGLSSPWDVVLSPDGKTLYVAMAGPHQLWQVETATGVAKAIAGSGRETLTDGPAMEAALAQPSGLALTASGETLYFADSETSAVRLLDLRASRVLTLIGEGLFDFGEVDGAYPNARLQHPLGVAYIKTAEGPRVLVADTYNHKVRAIDPQRRSVGPWLGAGRGVAAAAGELRLDEPGGISVAGVGEGARVLIADTNNHRVVVVNPADKSWAELMVTGLDGVGGEGEAGAGGVPEGASRVTVKAAEGEEFELTLRLRLGGGMKLNPEAPLTVRVRVVGADGKPGATVAQRTKRVDGSERVDGEAGGNAAVVRVPGEAMKAGAVWLVEVSYAACTEGDNAACIPGEAAWVVTVAPGGGRAGVVMGAP
jgi:DNA-binding beta-propeller fold protein YncE/thiol-disulfide isomerase/thioredoxin